MVSFYPSTGLLKSSRDRGGIKLPLTAFSITVTSFMDGIGIGSRLGDLGKSCLEQIVVSRSFLEDIERKRRKSQPESLNSPRIK